MIQGDGLLARIKRRLRARCTLSASIVVLLTAFTVISVVVVASVIIIEARSTFFELRQDQLTADFDERIYRVNAVLEGTAKAASPPVSGANTGEAGSAGGAAAQVNVEEVWNRISELLPDRSIVILADADSSAGNLAPSVIPERLRGDQRALWYMGYERATVDGELVYLVSHTLDYEVAGEIRPLTVVSMYSMQAQVNQVGNLTRSAGLGVAAILVLILIGGWIAGRWITRPLRRLRGAAEAIGEGAQPDSPQTIFADIESIGQRLEESAKRVAEREPELRLKERQSRQLVADVSHEFRTPLMSMNSALDILKFNADDPAPQAGSAETDPAAAYRADLQFSIGLFDRGIHRLSGLIEELLDLSRIESNAVQIQKTRVNLKELLTEIAATLEPGKRLELDLPEDVLINTDRHRLIKILNNLIVNAFIHGRPPVSVRLAAQNDSAVEVWVADSGDGIAPEISASLFDRFVMANHSRSFSGDNRRGSGLGLAIARENALLLGGDVRLVETAQPGATFAVTIRRDVATSSGD